MAITGAIRGTFTKSPELCLERLQLRRFFRKLYFFIINVDRVPLLKGEHGFFKKIHFLLHFYIAIHKTNFKKIFNCRNLTGISLLQDGALISVISASLSLSTAYKIH